MKPRRHLVIGVGLALVTLAVYWPVRHFEFVDFDDHLFVTGNPHVQQGLTWAGVKYAFTSKDAQYWAPLTWLSLLVEYEFHQQQAGGYHLTNLLLHTTATVLLFYVLAAMTGTTWRSAFVAALFGLHPLHVESVAWMTERKDVLSAVFWMLTLGAYGRYAASDQSSVVSDQLQKETERGPRRSRSTANRSLMPPRRRWYALTVLCLALGLMTKPMVMTLPFVLLLLDYWPLRRAQAVPLKRRLAEKSPLLLLAAVSCFISVRAYPNYESVLTPDVLTVGKRLSQVLMAYATYLRQTVWPCGLAFYYPYPVPGWSVGQVAGAALLLAGLTGLAVWHRRRRPYLAVGWCWFLGTLVPVIGLIELGPHWVADRYMYLPLIGLGLALAWGLGDIVQRWPRCRPIVAGTGVAAVAIAAFLTSRLVPRWRTSETLFRRATQVTRDNWVAHTNLGKTLLQAGRVTESLQQFEQAARINPGRAELHNNLGIAWQRLDRAAEALHAYRQAVRLQPDYADAHYNLGLVLAGARRFPEAIEHFRHALRLNPMDADAHRQLADALTALGQNTAAAEHDRQAQRLESGPNPARP